MCKLLADNSSFLLSTFANNIRRHICRVQQAKQNCNKRRRKKTNQNFFNFRLLCSLKENIFSFWQLNSIFLVKFKVNWLGQFAIFLLFVNVRYQFYLKRWSLLLNNLKYFLSSIKFIIYLKKLYLKNLPQITRHWVIFVKPKVFDSFLFVIPSPTFSFSSFQTNFWRKDFSTKKLKGNKQSNFKRLFIFISTQNLVS